MPHGVLAAGAIADALTGVSQDRCACPNRHAQANFSPRSSAGTDTATKLTDSSAASARPAIVNGGGAASAIAVTVSTPPSAKAKASLGADINRNRTAASAAG